MDHPVCRRLSHCRFNMLLRSRQGSPKADNSGQLLGRTIQSIAGIVGQFLAAVGGWCGAVQNCDSVAENHDFPPTAAPWKIVIEVGKFVSTRVDLKPCPEHELDFHRRQTA